MDNNSQYNLLIGIFILAALGLIVPNIGDEMWLKAHGMNLAIWLMIGVMVLELRRMA